MIDAPEFHDVKLKEYCTEANIDLKERTFAMFFATPFSGCWLLAPLSFFSKEELPADCEVILRKVEKPKEPQTSLQLVSLNEYVGSQGLLCQRTWFSSPLP